MQIGRWDSAIAFTNAKAEVILLDDAYQQSKSWFYILLTSYGELYSDDFMLPTGNLRVEAVQGLILLCNKMSG
jgi:tetraacyldisaccharide-1-P 4'-kinase